MRYKELETLIADLPTTQAVMLLGPPGIGKTSLGASVARVMTERRRAEDPSAPEALHYEADLSSSLPEDLIGLPKLDGDVTRYLPVTWVSSFCQPGAYGVCVLDDLPASPQAVQVACRQMALARRVHENKFAPGVRVIVTGNRREDKSCATQLPSHFRNSVLTLTLEPDLDDWACWAAEHNVPGVIASYLRFRPGKFSMLPKDQDEETGAFATPRTWAMLGWGLEAAEKHKAVLQVGAGLVGTGTASDFIAFLKVHNELPDIKALLENPVGVLPNPPANQPDRVIALVSALGETTAKLMGAAKGPKRDTAARNFFRALGHVTRSNREYCGAGVATFLANGGKINDLLPVVPSLTSDPLAKDLLGHLRKSLG